MTRSADSDGRNWAQRPELLSRYCCDLIASELKRLRPVHDLTRHPILPDTPLSEDGLQLDSLERMRLVMGFCEALQHVSLDTERAMLEARSVRDMIAVASTDPTIIGRSLTFRSTGSQGEASRTIHGWAFLEPEVRFWRDGFRECRRIVSMVPSDHLYGFLFSIALPAALDLEQVDMRYHTPRVLKAMLKPGDLVVAPGFFWEAAVSSGPWPADVSGVCSGSKLKEDTAEALVSEGLSHFVEIYGSTETGGIGVREAGELYYNLLPFWRRAGDEVRRVEGPPVVLPLPDVVDWFLESHLLPVRRLDRLVQVAGTNVSLEKVASIIEAHPGVLAARVRLMRPDEGDRLKAFVVPNIEAGPIVLEDLLHWLATRVGSAELPKSVVCGDKLPTGPTGKDCDWFIE